MKKVLLVAAVAGLAMASCRKDRTCECTDTSSSGFTVVTTTKAKSTKKDAVEWCENAYKSASTTVNGAAVTGSSNSGYSCKVK
jgi:hypothetical protein